MKKDQGIIKYEDLEILVVRHTYVPLFAATPTGQASILINFLKKRGTKVIEIFHPFSYSAFINSTVIYHSREETKILSEFPGIKFSELLLFFRDALATLFFVLTLKKRFQLYIGVDSLNALMGVFFRKIGLVQKVVFYVIDYTPQRFPNPIKNILYQFICRIAAKSSDCIWNLSPKMAGIWEQSGVAKVKNLVVPGGTFIKTKIPTSFTSINRNDLVYVGHLDQLKGLQLILEAFPAIVGKIPDVKLTIIGTGPLERNLKDLVRKLRLEEHVEFLGHIPDYGQLLQLISKCAVGLAPYVPDPASYTFYADPGKIKEYLSCGLPVIITKVPDIAFEIEKNGAGLAINYSRDELVEAVVKLLTDERLFMNCRKNAIKLAAKYDWDTIFNEAFGKMLLARTPCEGAEK